MFISTNWRHGYASSNPSVRALDRRPWCSSCKVDTHFTRGCKKRFEGPHQQEDDALVDSFLCSKEGQPENQKDIFQWIVSETARNCSVSKLTTLRTCPKRGPQIRNIALYWINRIHHDCHYHSHHHRMLGAACWMHSSVPDRGHRSRSSRMHCQQLCSAAAVGIVTTNVCQSLSQSANQNRLRHKMQCRYHHNPHYWRKSICGGVQATGGLHSTVSWCNSSSSFDGW